MAENARLSQTSEASRTNEASHTDEIRLDHLLVEGLTEYAIFVVSADGVVLRWNLGAQHLFGYAADEIVGRNFSVLFTPEDVATDVPDEELANALTGPKTGNDRWHIRRDGSRFWGTNTAQPLYNEQGALLGFTKIVHDLTEQYLAAEALREAAQKLQSLVETTQHASLHDGLTGLANRQLFDEYLERAIARSERRPESASAVLFLDLDKFKATNDSIGHVLADQLLVQVARRIEHAMRREDVLARIGGDEFAILLEDINGPADAAQGADRILKCLRAPFTIEGSEVSTNASIGVAIVSNLRVGTSSASRILEDADLAMYEAKSRGGGRYSLFQDEMRTRAGAVRQLDKDLREAMERNQFRLFYRPIVEIATRRITGYEALVRWQHRQRGLLSPDEFRAKAEESGIMVAIDRWALLESARQLAAWQAIDGCGRLTMSLNLSATQFERPGLAREIHEILAEVALPPQSMIVDITEAVTMDNSERIIGLLKEMREAGVAIHLDDFGTGRSSFIYLRRLPISALKIDSFLVRGLGTGKNIEIVRAMTVLAQGLGFKCIAKGVETEQQLAALAQLGCGEAQGLLFSEPVRADGARALLAISGSHA
ncbi:MAG: putative bifunctional diguanylate cyclase/phosphodiesterase [Vulcanimicrobiaceae bacterium]